MKEEDILAEKILALEKKWAELLKGPKRSKERPPIKGRITAAELDARLEQDEEYQKWFKESETVRLQLAEALKEGAKELLDDLRKVGIDIESISDLINTSSSYKPAIPVLVRHLSRPYHRSTKEGIVRSLAVKEAKGVACRAIIDEYHKAPKDESSYRWTYGNTMSVIVTPEYMDDLIAIVLDEGNGESRHMFVRALGKIKSPEVKEALQRLQNDENEMIRKEAQKALKKFK